MLGVGCAPTRQARAGGPVQPEEEEVGLQGGGGEVQGGSLLTPEGDGYRAVKRPVA